MSVYIDRKYLLLISGRLEKFAEKNTDLFNFRCPLCGDSRKNKVKARGYVYRKGNDYYYICHNCNVSTTFPKFLKHMDETYFREYTLERYTVGDNNKNYQKPAFKLDGPKPSDVFNKRSSITNINLKSIDKLPENHPAVEYIKSRKIPQERWNEIFHHDAFKDFMDSCFPNHGKTDIPNDSRVILFYTNEKGEITNVAGRALGDSKIRYITIKVTDEKKLFGLHRLRSNETVYIMEGQFDSFFVPNSVASGDSNLVGVPGFLSNYECTLIYDNEPRNKEIVKQISKAVENDMSIVLFPETIPYKDVNEMIINGMTQNELMDIIRDNTFQGLSAKLRFVEWKKC